MTPTLISGTGTPASKDRELPPFVGSLLSQWDARYAGDGAIQPGSRVSENATSSQRSAKVFPINASLEPLRSHPRQ